MRTNQQPGTGIAQSPLSSESSELSLVENLMKIREFSGGDDGIYTRVLNKSSEFSTTLYRLTGGAEVPTHAISGQGCLIVLSGTGILNVGDSAARLEPGVYAHLPVNQPHSIEADDELIFLQCLSHLVSPGRYAQIRDDEHSEEVGSRPACS